MRTFIGTLLRGPPIKFKSPTRSLDAVPPSPYVPSGRVREADNGTARPEERQSGAKSKFAGDLLVNFKSIGIAAISQRQ